MMRTMTLINKNPFPDWQLTRELAITALEDVCYFLIFGYNYNIIKGSHGHETLSVSSIANIDKIINLKHASARQATLRDYYAMISQHILGFEHSIFIVSTFRSISTLLKIIKGQKWQTSEIRTTSKQRTKGPFPKCPSFGGLTVYTGEN